MASIDSERFAIYFTLAQDDVLYQKAAKWLGHCVYRKATDANAETMVFSPSLEKFRSVQQAAQYGFHATLKPPFRLRAGMTRTALADSLAEFASGVQPFKCGPLKVASLGHFIALVLAKECDALNQLACQCVETFNPFRAPLNQAEMQKRLQSPLSSRQRQLLEQWGYPYVFDEFRFHLTLTDRLADRLIEDAVRQLDHEFSPLLVTPLQIDRIGLFHQEQAGTPFHLVKSYLLGNHGKSNNDSAKAGRTA